MSTHNTHHSPTRSSWPVKKSGRYAWGLGLSVLLSAAALSLLLSSETAQADALPPRPATPMPFQNPAQPTEDPLEWSINLTPAAQAQPAESAAYIELHLPSSASGHLYTVVQWQDKRGSWHDVEGWQQAAAPGQTVRWAVYPRDFGTGPFRWAVYAAPGAQWIGASAAFRLPCCSSNTVLISQLSSIK